MRIVAAGALSQDGTRARELHVVALRPSSVWPLAIVKTRGPIKDFGDGAEYITGEMPCRSIHITLQSTTQIRVNAHPGKLATY